MTNFSSSYLPIAGYPPNATGACEMTKNNASYCYDTQRNAINKTYTHLTSEQKPNLTWPIVGAVTSMLSLIAVSAIKRGRI